MSTRETAHIRRALTAKGFQEEQTHHEMFWLYAQGKRTSMRTRISHGKREYGDQLLALMAKQLGLGRGEFDDLVDCPLTGEQYLQLMVERGRVRLED